MDKIVKRKREASEPPTMRVIESCKFASPKAILVCTEAMAERLSLGIKKSKAENEKKR